MTTERPGQRDPGWRRGWAGGWPGRRQSLTGPPGAWCPAPAPGGGRARWFGGYRLAAVVAVITITSTFAWHGHNSGAGMGQMNPAGWVLLVLACAALLLRRRYPAATLGIAGAAVAAYFALGNPAGTVFLPLAIAFGGAVLAGYRLLAWATWPVVYAFVIWGPHYLAGAGPAPSVSQALTNAAWPLLILIGAEMIRAGRERAATAARGRAEHQRRQAEQARRRASEERVRIAQELHDVVAHNISLINVQAGVALHLMDSDGDQSPEQTRAALAAIKQASKETLGELRSVLGILRAEPGEHAPLSPTAGLDQLDGLVARATSAGLSVHTEITGDRVPLLPSADLAAYRIVQEALTNVIKHAGAAEVTVGLAYGETSLRIEVTDDGATATGATATGATATGATTTGATATGAITSSVSSGGTAAGPSGAGGTRGGEADDEGGDSGGSGIPGMRERTRMLGGEFSAGPLPTGGFRVSAVLPLRRYDSAAADAEAGAGAGNASQPPATGADTSAGAPAASSAPATGRDGAA